MNYKKNIAYSWQEFFTGTPDIIIDTILELNELIIADMAKNYRQAMILLQSRKIIHN